MPFVKEISVDEVSKIGIWYIAESTGELISQLYLNQEELNYLSQFKTENRKKQWLSYRVLIRKMVQIDTIYKIYYTPTGKPFLVHPPHVISVSHSQNYSTVIITSDIKLRVGIDIEKISERIFAIREKFLHPSEIKQYGSDIFTLTQLWCAKEAVFKCLDSKNISFRNTMITENIVSKNQTTYIRILVKQEQGETYFNVISEQFEDYILSYVIDKQE